MARCKYCNKEIIWMQEGRKKVPVEVDGAKHECDEFKNSVKSARKVEVTDIDPEILAQYQANLKASIAKNKDKKKTGRKE